ncbi:hypothetical protein CSA_023871, partial [Cucumis sativus]
QTKASRVPRRLPPETKPPAVSPCPAPPLHSKLLLLCSPPPPVFFRVSPPTEPLWPFRFKPRAIPSSLL